MNDPMFDYINNMYERHEHTELDPPSLDPSIIKTRKALLDAAFEGDLEAQLELRQRYGLTMLYRNGTTINLKGLIYVEKD